MSEVEVTLNGKSQTLRCTLRAAKAVNAGGGFMAVLSKLAAMDQDFYCLVAAAGLGKKPSEVEADVYRTGLPQLTEPLSSFVMLLANGGRPIVASEANDGEGEA